MPTTEIGTLSESGQTNIGSYSLCFPYYIAEKDYYEMVLCCRNSSNTAKNILRTGKLSSIWMYMGKRIRWCRKWRG